MEGNTFVTTRGDRISLAFGRRPTVGRTGSGPYPRVDEVSEGSELVGDFHLSLSQIVREARRIDVDPRRDGFSHHNPNLNVEDDLFYNALAVDRVIEGLFRGRDLSAAEEQFMRLVRLGILDEREGFDMLMTAATRAMRHTSATVMRLWTMYENERQRVCVLQALGD